MVDNHTDITSKKTLLNEKWFIILIGFITLGIYPLTLYLINKYPSKKKYFISIAIILPLVAIIIISYILIPKGEIELDLIKYHATVKYTVPAVEKQEAVYEEINYDPITIFVGDPDNGQNEIFADENLDSGKYKVIDFSVNKYCKLMLKSKSDFDKYSGETLYKQQTFDFSSFKKLSGFNCTTNGKGLSVTLQKISEKILVSEAVAGKPAYDVVEKIAFTDFKKICYSDDKEIECDKLTKLDEFDKLISNKSKLKQEILSTQKLKVFNNKETCYINNIEEPCENLLLYNKLKKQIVIK